VREESQSQESVEQDTVEAQETLRREELDVLAILIVDTSDRLPNDRI